MKKVILPEHIMTMSGSYKMSQISKDEAILWAETGDVYDYTSNNCAKLLNNDKIKVGNGNREEYDEALVIKNYPDPACTGLRYYLIEYYR